MRVFVASLALFGYSCCASAQTADMKQLDRIIDRYHACFYASVQSQFVAKLDAEPNMVAELAFQACGTEEQTLGSFLSLHSTPSATVNAIILKHRNALKRKITG